MKPPDWKRCTEEELWHYVAWHLEGAGIRSVLVGGAVVAIYTDCVKDRLAGYIHWNSRANFDQAVLICRRQVDRVDLKQVERWCGQEGGLAAFKELERHLRDGA